MKLINKNEVYVQIRDLKNLLDIIIRIGIEVTPNVLNQCFNPLNNETILDEKKYIKISGKDAIEFFKKLYYIVDINEFKDYKIEELLNYKNILLIVKEGIIAHYDKLLDEDSIEKLEQIQFDFFLINYKIEDFDRLIKSRKRILKNEEELSQNKKANKIKKIRGLF